MTTAFRSVLLFSLLCFLTVGVAWGQSFRPADSQFTQNFGVDSVNLQDLSVSINVPVLQKPGMIPFNLAWEGNSDCEHVIGSPTQHFTVCGVALGKDYTLSGNNQVFGRVSAVGSWRLTPGLSQNMTCVADNRPEVKYSYWSLSGPDGTSYQFPTSDYTIVETGGSSCTTGFTDTTLSGGLTVPVSGSGGFVSSITLANGFVNGTCGFCDPFGNALTATSTVYTDTLNDAAVTVTPQSGATGEIDTYQDTGATSRQIKQILTAETFKTNFGCTGWVDTTTTGYATTEVDYPDGNNLYFTYEAITGGITGRIYQVTNRTGGTASYTYGSYNCNGIRPNSITRTTVDGATTYTFANLGTNGSTTTVIDPGTNKTVYTFQGTNGAGSPQAGVPLTMTEVQTWQNTNTVASPSYTLLSTTIYCYNGNSTNCPTTQASYPITEKDTYVAPGSKTTYSRTKQLFDSYGNVTSIARYPFTTIGGGTADNTTAIQYGTWNGSACVAIGSGIVNKPCRIQTVDNASHVLADKTFGYSSKGFVNGITVWTGSSWIPTTFSPNLNGTVASSTNPLGLVTSFTYGACNSMLPTATSKTVNSVVLTTGATWDCNMGKLLTATDANSNQATFTYDLLGRGHTQAYPGSDTFTENYPTANTETIADSFTTTTSTVDGLGRPIRSQTTDGASYDTVSTSYGFIAGTNPQWQVNWAEPCITSLGSDCSLVHASRTDPIGRQILGYTNSNENVATAYNQNDASTTLSPAPSGENNKTAQTEYDGLGRVISTCAIQATGGTACGQIDGNSGILTSYAYAYGAGQTLVTATRGSQQHLTYADAAGRVKQVQTPETGTTTFYYDTAPSACPTSVASSGNLTCTVDANGAGTIYVYDAINRLTDTNNSGACRRFRYDATSNGIYTAPTGYTANNIKGRILEASTDDCTFPFSQAHMITDEWFAYDDYGRITDVWETTPHSGGWYHPQVAYAVNGALASISGVPGTLTYTVTLDSNGRPDSSKYGTNVVGSNVVYNGAGQPTEIDYQASDKDLFPRDPNTGLMTGWTFTVGAASETATLTWNPNRTLKTLAITDGFNSGGTQTCHYNPTDAVGSGYDDVGRLVGANCGTPWTQTYSYDQYNNFSKSGTTNWNPGYNSTVTCPTGTVCNHITGGGYDSDGQVTYDLNNSYAWDGYHKMTTANSGSSLGSCGSAGVTCVTYDAFGRPAERNVAGTFSEFLYSPIGLVGMMTGMTNNNLRLPIPGGSNLWVNSSGNSVDHSDWLGNVRIRSLGSSVTLDAAYSPYGELYSLKTGNSAFQTFTGLKQDLFAGLYDTPNREFDTSSGSRWLSPDPAHASWNAYSYPTNPNSMIDPSGLDAISIVQHKQLGFGDLERYDTLSSFSNPYDPTNPSSSESMFLSGVSIAPLAGGTSSASGMSVVYKFSGEPGGAVFQTTSFGNPVNYYDVFTGTNLGNGFVKPTIPYTPLGKPGVARPKHRQKQKKGHYLFFSGVWFNYFTSRRWTSGGDGPGADLSWAEIEGQNAPVPPGANIQVNQPNYLYEMEPVDVGAGASDLATGTIVETGRASMLGTLMSGAAGIVTGAAMNFVYSAIGPVFVPEHGTGVIPGPGGASSDW